MKVVGQKRNLKTKYIKMFQKTNLYIKVSNSFPFNLIIIFNVTR